MGFIKPYEKPSGMVFNYHRIASLTISTNTQNVIEVMSYFSVSKREAELENLIKMRTNPEEAYDLPAIFTDSDFIVTPYDPSMTIDSAYEYVLSLPQFENAEMEDTEHMLDALEAELAEQQQQADIQQPQEESDVE